MMETYKKKIKFCYNLTCRLSAFSISPYFLPDFSLPTIRTIIYSTSVWATASLPLGLTVCILRTLTFHVPSMVFAHAVPTICNASPPHPHPLGLSSVTPSSGKSSLTPHSRLALVEALGDCLIHVCHALQTIIPGDLDWVHCVILSVPKDGL